MPSALLPEPSGTLDATATAARLPWTFLADEIAALLRDDTVSVPARSVLPLPGGGSLFVMPATDGTVAMTKLITLTPANAGTGRPAIQGDVVVFDIATGVRSLVLDGPTVTARRTAAASLLAARHLAQVPTGPLLVVGAGVQGLAHAQAFVEGLGVRDVWVASRRAASALAAQVRALGCDVVRTGIAARPGPVLFKSCGWAGWDLAAARLAVAGRPA